MKARVKYRVNSILRAPGSEPVVSEGGETPYQPAGMWSISLLPVYGYGDPDQDGKIELVTVDADAVSQFAPDKQFYVDFIPVGEGK